MDEPQEQFVDFKCPKCGKDVSFPANWGGSVQQCPWCSQDLVVPEKLKEPAKAIRLDIRLPRLFFRRLHEQDRNDLLEIIPDNDSLHYLNWRTMDGEDVERWLAEDTKLRLIQIGLDVYFGVELEKNSKLIAVVSFNYYSEEHRAAHFNIVVNRAFRRKGYGTEIVHGVLGFAFGELNLHRVVAVCDSRNIAGLKMLDKAGMRREGEFIESRKLRDEWVNSIHYATLQREWRRD